MSRRREEDPLVERRRKRRGEKLGIVDLKRS